MPIAVIVHGGAKEIPPEKAEVNRRGCARAAEAAWQVVSAGGCAIDAVEAAIRSLEDDPTFNAGYGSELNADGEVQMDAGLMDGKDLKSGAVGFIQRVRHPISVAKQVYETGEVLLVGDGAQRFAEEHGQELSENQGLITQERLDTWQEKQESGDKDGANNTVGCVVLDSQGHFAAGASTGGTGNNSPGRLGDTPQVGCGFYADDEVGGCSLTGDGEEIARMVVAKSAIDQLRQTGCPECVVSKVIEQMAKRVGGEAGLIMIDKEGGLGWNHNSANMAVAYRTEGMPEARAFIHKKEESA